METKNTAILFRAMLTVKSAKRIETVGELIRALQNYPIDTKVGYYDGNPSSEVYCKFNFDDWDYCISSLEGHLGLK